MRYARVVLIADLSDRYPKLNNGTATLLRLGSLNIAVTCAHVLAKYRELWLSDRKAIFQIGSVKLEPTAQVIAESAEADLATISLSDEQVEMLERNGANFINPVEWPPEPVTESDWVSIGGYPGSLKTPKGGNVLDFTGYGIGATPVSSVTPEKISCRFERERWVWSENPTGMADPSDLGGFSGAPALVHRQLYWELAGIVFQFAASYDIMFIRPAGLIEQDGSVREP